MFSLDKNLISVNRFGIWQVLLISYLIASTQFKFIYMLINYNDRWIYLLMKSIIIIHLREIFEYDVFLQNVILKKMLSR